MSQYWNPEEAVRAHGAATRADRPERRQVELAGQAINDDGANFWVRVVNLSYDGCMVVCEEPIRPGQTFKLSVLGRGGIDVEVVWADAGKAGLRFAKPSEAASARTPRAAERLDLVAEISLRRPGRPSFQVRICDISTHGCRCEFVDRPAAGEKVVVKLEGLEPLAASTRWVDPPLTGVKFDRPIHPAVFDLLMIRLGSN